MAAFARVLRRYVSSSSARSAAAAAAPAQQRISSTTFSYAAASAEKENKTAAASAENENKSAAASAGDDAAAAMESMLRRELGLTPSQVESLRRKREALFRSGANAAAAAAALAALRDAGLADEELRRAVEKCPSVLETNAQNHLWPRLQLLHALGLSGDELASVLSGGPRALTVTLDNLLERSLRFFGGILGPDADVARTLRSHSWLLFCDIDRHAGPVLEILRRHGVHGEPLALLVAKSPNIVCLPVQQLQTLIDYVAERGFRTSASSATKNFVCALFVVHKLGVEGLEERVELLSALGLESDEAWELFRTSPLALAASPDKMQRLMEFLVNVASLPPNIVVSYPSLFSYSLEGRLKRRHRVLQEIAALPAPQAAEIPSLVSVVALSDKKFLDRFVAISSPHADRLMEAFKGRPGFN